MPFLLSSVAALCENNIRDAWPAQWDHSTSEGAKLIRAFSRALSDSFAASIKSTLINGGQIIGGTSPPGGPVVGAVLSIPAGSIISSAPRLKQAFSCPDFTVDALGTPKHGAYSSWMRAVVEHIDSNLSTQWSTWMKTWSLPSGDAHGGVAAWVPPPSASPGPWTLGTITPFVFMGQGTNASPALENLARVAVNSGRAKTAYVELSGEVVGNVAVADSNSKELVESVCRGVSKSILDVFKQIIVKDPTGSSAVGTAVPVAGNIVGGTVSGLVFDVT